MNTGRKDLAFLDEPLDPTAACARKTVPWPLPVRALNPVYGQPVQEEEQERDRGDRGWKVQARGQLCTPTFPCDWGRKGGRVKRRSERCKPFSGDVLHER